MFSQVGSTVYKAVLRDGVIVKIFHRQCELPCDAAIMVRELNSIYPGEYHA